MFKGTGTLVAVVLLVGCATAKPIPLGNDSYMISQTSAGGVFKSMGSLKSDVIARANSFAESKGKVAIPLAAKESPAIPGARMPNFEYQFQLVDKNDPRASGNALTPRADAVVELKTAAPQSSPSVSKPDLYSELMKLDDLRKRGVITEAEFQAQKARLLSSQ